MGLPFETFDVGAEEVVGSRGWMDPECGAGDGTFCGDGLGWVFDEGEEGEEFCEGLGELEEGGGRARGCCGHCSGRRRLKGEDKNGVVMRYISATKVCSVQGSNS